MNKKFYVFLSILSVIFGRMVLAEQPSPKGYFYFDEKQGNVLFRVRSKQLQKPSTFTVSELWNYSSKKKKWLFESSHTFIKKIIPSAIPLQEISLKENDPIVQDFKNLIGLYWVKWRENEIEYNGFISAGMKCQDVMIFPLETEDQIAMCVPYRNSASVMYVPKPEKYCIKKLAP